MLLDILFPTRCVGCGLLGARLCLSCGYNLPYIRVLRCIYCGRASVNGKTHTACRSMGAIDNQFSFFHYRGTIRKIITDFKYRGSRDVFSELALALSVKKLSGLYRAISSISPAYFQPIPLHPNRLRSRGFNQAEIIARFCSYHFGYPVIDVLSRIVDTPQQATILGRSDRISNMKGAFLVHRIPPKSPIILVDDVVTTGSTVSEAARALKRSGVSSVGIISLARD